MDRRRIFLVVAVVVALLGTALVFLYVRGADQRAESRFDTVEVLRATQAISPGESIDDAAAAGKITKQAVVRDYLQAGYQTDLEDLAGQYATAEIYPGEQIVSEKFGADAVAVDSGLDIEDGDAAYAVELTDPARVAGFVNPGSEVVVYFTGTGADDKPFTQMLLERVRVLGVGSTASQSTAPTTAEGDGEVVAEQLPTTLLTMSLDQREAEKVIYAQANGTLWVGLLTDKSEISADSSVSLRTLFK